MKKSWLSIVVTLTFVGLSANSLADEVRIRYSETLQQLEMRTDAALSAKPSDSLDAERMAAMQFNAFGRHFDLQLAPNRALLQQLSAKQRPTGVGVYRGTLNGVPDSWVRMVIDGDSATGMIFDGTTAYAIERDELSGRPIMFRLEDLEIPPNSLACSALTASNSGAQLLSKVSADVSSQVQAAPGATQNIDVAVIADFEFTSDKGAGNAAAEMLTRMNNVDGIFSDQLGVQITVNRTDTFSTASDPFSDETDSELLIDELSDYRNGNADQRSNGLSHLFTGRNLDGSTVGIAYTSAVCSRRFGVGLTQGTHSATFDSLIAAHELGHNFGAPHDGTSGSACESTTGDWLMSPRLNGTDQFSACSISEMQSVVSQASCVTALPTTDVAVFVDSSPATPLLGNQEQVSFSVDSVGTNDASNVAIDVTIPNNVTLDSITVAGGSCTTGAGIANCTVSAITAGSGSLVSMFVTLDAVGSAQFVADVTATGDSNVSNNQNVLNIDIAPAVDLVVTAPAVGATLNQATTVNVTIQNQSSIAATSAQVTVTPDAGLRLDSASWSAGSCTVSGGNATCDATSLAPQASTTVALNVTGTAEGSQGYSVSVSASETERDAASNSASGSVAVSTPNNSSGGGDDSGGGAAGWLLLGSLFVVLARRRKQLAVS